MKDNHILHDYLVFIKFKVVLITDWHKSEYWIKKSRNGCQDLRQPVKTTSLTRNRMKNVRLKSFKEWKFFAWNERISKKSWSFDLERAAKYDEGWQKYMGVSCYWGFKYWHFISFARTAINQWKNSTRFILL